MQTFNLEWHHAGPEHEHPRLKWERNPAASVVTLQAGGQQRVQMTYVPGPREELTPFLHRVGADVRTRGIMPLQVFCFGPLDVRAVVCSELSSVLGMTFQDSSLPVTWVDGRSCSGRHVAGIQIHGVTAGRVEPVEQDGVHVGYVHEDEHMRECFLWNVTPANPGAENADQVRNLFETIAQRLSRAGFELRNLVRTWFFLGHILGWYARFNNVRNEVFAAHGLKPEELPASTGVGARMPAGTAVVAAARALAPRHAGVHIRSVPSPAQCPATRYGSAFNRALEISTPVLRQLLISGTASIGSDGLTRFVGEPEKQIGFTMDVLEQILASRQMTMANVVRAVAYFKTPSDSVYFSEWCSEHGLNGLVVPCVQCDICRPDLLFELELDAWALPAHA